MDKAFYLNVFYPFQDEVLRILNEEIETGFYLTGGTAASRGYLNHRFSDDLDFFINDDNRFGLWSERVIQKLSVMYLGEIVEIGPRAAIIEEPWHPYTRKLLAAVPVADPLRARRETKLSNEEIPSTIRPTGYRPPARHWREIGPDHLVREEAA